MRVLKFKKYCPCVKHPIEWARQLIYSFSSPTELAPAMDSEVYPADFRPSHNEVPFEIWVPLKGIEIKSA